MNPIPEYRLDWTQTGQKYHPTPEQTDQILNAIACLDFNDGFQGWQSIAGGSLELPMMPGLAIETAIREFRLPRVSHVAISNHLAPLGFYGIRAHFSAGRQRVDTFLVDAGTTLTPVVMRVFPIIQSDTPTNTP